MRRRRLQEAARWARQTGPLITSHLRQPRSGSSPDGHPRAAVDELANEVLLEAVRRSFPEDGVITEESGSTAGGQEFVWMIDPVDGTSNLLLGVPYAATAIALFHGGVLVGSVIFNPFTDELFVAERGRGAERNGVPLRAMAPANGAVGYYVQGYGTPTDTQVRILSALLPRSERILQTWAPSLDWCSLACASAGFLVAFETEIEDAVQGVLLLREAGGTVTDWHGDPVELPMERGRRVSLIASMAVDHQAICRGLETIPPTGPTPSP